MKKVKKIFTHPAILIISFLFLIIIGEEWGGFYVLYLLLALPHGGIHSLLALLGIIILVFSNYKYKRQFIYQIESILNIVGAVMLPLSLFVFFYQDKSHYNYQTFEQYVPLTLITFFITLTIIFVINSLTKIFRKEHIVYRQQ